MLDFPFERFRPMRPDRRQYQPIQVTPPASAPVTLAEAKAHIVVDFTDDDAYIQALVDGAVSYLDGYSGVLCRALCAQTWRQDFDVFDFYLKLPLAPVISIDSVKYDDANGVEQTVDPGNYKLIADGSGAIVRFKSTFTFPATSQEYPSVRVQYVAGYADTATTPPVSTVPGALKSAIKLMVGHWYENRETVMVGRSVAAVEIPFAATALLAPFRRIRL